MAFFCNLCKENRDLRNDISKNSTFFLRFLHKCTIFYLVGDKMCTQVQLMRFKVGNERWFLFLLIFKHQIWHQILSWNHLARFERAIFGPDGHGCRRLDHRKTRERVKCWLEQNLGENELDLVKNEQVQDCFFVHFFQINAKFDHISCPFEAILRQFYYLEKRFRFLFLRRFCFLESSLQNVG